MLTLTLILACGETEKDTTDSDTATQAPTAEPAQPTNEPAQPANEPEAPDLDPLECAELTVEACQTRDDCTTVDGLTLHQDGEEYCVDWNEESTPLGCLDMDTGCGEAETYAAPAGDPGDCYWFPTTCWPSGWVGCNITSAGECAEE